MFMCTTDALRNNIKPYELEYIAIMNILKHGHLSKNNFFPLPLRAGT